MSNLQLIEALCSLVENFAKVVRLLAAKLEQTSALDEAERQEVSAAFARYAEIIGADEAPDFCGRDCVTYAAQAYTEKDTCVLCGNYVPEGTLVCPLCEKKVTQSDHINR